MAPSLLYQQVASMLRCYAIMEKSNSDHLCVIAELLNNLLKSENLHYYLQALVSLSLGNCLSQNKSYTFLGRDKY